MVRLRGAGLGLHPAGMRSGEENPTAGGWGIHHFLMTFAQKPKVEKGRDISLSGQPWGSAQLCGSWLSSVVCKGPIYHVSILFWAAWPCRGPGPMGRARVCVTSSADLGLSQRGRGTETWAHSRSCCREQPHAASHEGFSPHRLSLLNSRQ